MILGLTGGLGCGKSTAAQIFARNGFRCLDSDRIVREEVFTRPAVLDALRGHFGPGIVAPDGTVNRARLGELVFADTRELRWLEALTHPLVFDYWREKLRQGAEHRWLLEVPLLFEKQLENWFDFIVCVTCAPALQLARLEQRGMSRELATQRISTQLPLERKIELSDFILLNDGTTEFLEKQVVLLLTALEGRMSVR